MPENRNGVASTTASCRGSTSQDIGGIILVMQRLHQADLAGHLIASPAAGTNCGSQPSPDDRRSVPLGGGRFYLRREGTPSTRSASRSPKLEEMRAQLLWCSPPSTAGPGPAQGSPGSMPTGSAPIPASRRQGGRCQLRHRRED